MKEVVKRILLVLLFVIVVLAIGLLTSEKETPLMAQQEKAIHYEIIKQWTIRGGGQGKRIVIPAAKANLKDLTALGEQLRVEARNDRFANVDVFTDRRAAEMMDRALDLNREEGRFYDKHFLGSYTKNSTTGHNQFAVCVEGVPGLCPYTFKYGP